MRLSPLPLLCLLLYPGSAASLRALTAVEPARIVRTGDLVRLEVQQAAAGEQIWFTLPEQGPSGTFADGTVRLAATASAAGIAEVSFTTGATPGPLLADAAVHATGETVSFAVTVLSPGDALPVVTAEQARAAAEQAASAAEAIHGPVLLRAGVEVRTPVPAVVFNHGAPFALPRDAWLAWTDSAPGARFGHLTQWLVFDAEDARLRIIHQDWWPELRVPGASEAQPLLPASQANSRLPGGFTAPSPRPPAPPDACLVGVAGDRLPGAVDDFIAMERFLAETGRVSPEGMRFGRTKLQVRNALRTASEAGCRRLFLLMTAHAGQARGGGVLLKPEEGSSYLTYAQLAEWLAPFTHVEAVLAASFAEDAASWFDGRGFEGAVLASAFAQTAPPLDPVRRLLQAAEGAATLSEAHAAAFAEGAAPPPRAITSGGERRFWLSDVAIEDAGGAQRIDIKRPLNLDLGPTLIYNASAADERIAGIQTKTFVLPSDQDLLRFSIGGRGRGETRYTMTLNDASRQVYTADGRVEVGSFTLADGVVLRTDNPAGARQRVAILRHGYWQRRQAPTTFHISSRDERIVSPVDATAIARTGEAAFELRAVGAGRTFVDIWDETADNAASVEVRVLGAPDPACPAEGSAEATFAPAPGGDPAGLAPRVALSRGSLYWKREGARIEIWSDRAPIVSATGAVTGDCRFEAAGESGQERVGGFQGVAASYENGRIAGGAIRFDYRLGPFDAGQTVTYAATGQAAAHTGALGSGALLAKQSGGEHAVAVGVDPGAAWTASTQAEWIQLAEADGRSGPGLLRFLVTPNGSSERRSAAVSAAGETVVVTQAAGPDLAEPLVTGVVNGATFQQGVASGAWLTITGFALAGETRTWFTEPAAGAAQAGGPLPTELAGVSVTIDGRPAYVQFVSPQQVNVLAPDDLTRGRAEVVVRNQGRESATVRTSIQSLAPELFRFQPREGRYPAAVHPDGTLVGPSGLFRTVATRPLKPGDVVLLFGSGFGATAPPAATGFLVTEPRELVSPALASVGGKPAEVLFGGLVAAGLYQFNVEAPQLPPGDYLVEIWSAGRRLETTAYVTVE